MAASSGAGGAKRATKAAAAAKRKAKKKPQNPNTKRLNQQELTTLVTNAAAVVHTFLSRNDVVLLPSQTLILESLLSSAVLSVRRDPKPLPHPPPPPPPPQSQPEGQCWFGRFLTAGENDPPLWTDAFRMSESSFTLLLRLLTPALRALIPSAPPKQALAAALYRLAHGAAYKPVARRFGLGSSADACRAFFAVCKAINEKLGHFFELRSDLGRVMDDFGWLSLPNCCGALGIGRFGVENGKLLGENGSLCVQALVDSDGRFLDVSAGWPTTLKPETILHQTKLYLGVEESGDLLNGPSFELGGNGGSIPQYVLGDSCFPLLPWLLTPYTRSNEEGDSFTSMEKAFNAAHRRAMGLVGTAFRRVRSRWRLLSKKWKEECLEFLPFVVITCCLLHNFLIKCSEPMVEEEEDEEEKREEKLPGFDGEMNESGQRIRDMVAMHLSRVCLKR